MSYVPGSKLSNNYVSKLWVEQMSGFSLIVYPGQDGLFRFVVVADGSQEREPEPSIGYRVREVAKRLGKQELERMAHLALTTLV